MAARPAARGPGRSRLLRYQHPALRPATEPGSGIAAVVPRGGHPDLARPGSLP